MFLFSQVKKFEQINKHRKTDTQDTLKYLTNGFKITPFSEKRHKIRHRSFDDKNDKL